MMMIMMIIIIIIIPELSCSADVYVGIRLNYTVIDYVSLDCTLFVSEIIQVYYLSLSS